MLVTMYSTVVRVNVYLISCSEEGGGDGVVEGESEEEEGRVPLNSFPERILEMW